MKKKLLDLCFEDDIFWFRDAVESGDFAEALKRLGELQRMAVNAQNIILSAEYPEEQKERFSALAANARNN